MDPSNLATIADIATDRCEMRVLDVQCSFDDSYLNGHAQRIGLASADISPNMSGPLVTALRNNIRTDQESLHELALPALYTISEKAEDEMNAVALAYFMKISTSRAEKVAQSLSFE